MTMPYALCSSSASRARRKTATAAVSLLALALTACASGDAANAIGSAADSALSTIGLKRASADSNTGFEEVAIRIHAAKGLNAGPDGKGTALVVHLYKLRSAETLSAMSPEAILNASREKETLGADLIELRELILTPQQTLELKEKIPREAAVIAIAGAFRTPLAQRWRAVFDRAASAKTGVVLGAHACAFSVSVGSPVGWGTEIPARLGSTRCGQTDSHGQAMQSGELK
ncbi:type VI secretion system lipoprotein TssJ [Niveibacterium sp.]|uniref:type VI secretion system lipoprotein TssJ n=1 Tax=Niveibacterium sp. TaxID=2017444 RepID=UPI0035ADCCEE